MIKVKKRGKYLRAFEHGEELAAYSFITKKMWGATRAFSALQEYLDNIPVEDEKEDEYYKIKAIKNGDKLLAIIYDPDLLELMEHLLESQGIEVEVIKGDEL